MYKIRWEKKPEKHDYPAAVSYLSLIYPVGDAKLTVRKLLKAEITKFKAKDIFRASQLSLLGISNYHVEKNVKKIQNKEKMVPILLIRDSINGKVVIADGYHRLCAVYHVDEDAMIPCKII